MKRVKFCPNCMEIIGKKDTECKKCGMKVEDMEGKEVLPDYNPLKGEKKKKEYKDDQGNIISKKEYKKLQESKEINFEEAFLNEDDSNKNPDENTVAEESVDDLIKRKRHKHKPKKKDTPEFSIDESGEYKIETKDVTFFENLEGQEEYSVRKARGDIKEDKIEWWEIYKWADKMLARRKVKKEVNKASVVRPDFISKTKMILLCLFFGWMGAHNFYARNTAKGWTVLSMLAVAIIIIQIPVLYQIMGVFVGGGLGFAVMFLWLHDLIALCFNKYRYRITKMQFIKKLNATTRAKLGKKYIDIK